MRRRTIFYTATTIIGIILFAFAVSRIGVEEIFTALSAISLWQYLTLVALNIFGMVIAVWRWKIILRAQTQLPLRFDKLFIARTIAGAINYLTPSVFVGGEPFKALIVKEELKVPLQKTVASIIIDEAIYLTTVLAVLVIGIFTLLAKFFVSFYVFIIMMVTAVFCISIFYIFYSRTINHHPDKRGFFTFLIELLKVDKIKVVNDFKPKIAETEKEISLFFRTHKKELLIVILLAIFDNINSLFTAWLTVLFIGYQMDISQILSVIALTYTTYLLPIPAALGGFELSQSYIFELFGLGAITGLTFSIVTRLASLVMVAMGLLFLLFFEIQIVVDKLLGIVPKWLEAIKKIFEIK